MNKAIYTATLRSIRDNGMRYTLQHAIDTDNSDALFVCEEISSIMRDTDWLAMREQFAKSGNTNHAFRLTTTVTKTTTN
jgi:hypothetical protein